MLSCYKKGALLSELSEAPYLHSGREMSSSSLGTLSPTVGRAAWLGWILQSVDVLIPTAL